MAYDRELAERIRAVIGEEPALTTKAMFGGFAFLVGGSMAVAAGSRGDLMLRCDPADAEALVAEAGVDRMVMKGKAMNGWLSVEPEALESEESLRRWVDVGLTYARGLRR